MVTRGPESGKSAPRRLSAGTVVAAVGLLLATALLPLGALLVAFLLAPSGDESPAPPRPAERARIVSLAPHLTELAYTAGAGESLVGTVAWSDYPEPARRLPRIGDAFRFDAEAIVALEATDALAWSGGTPPATIAQLRSLGVEVHEIETRSLDDIAAAMTRIGVIAGSGARAADARRDYQLRLAALRADAPDSASIEVFYQVSERPLFTLGGRHVINEVLGLCGARNVFASLPVEAAPIGLEAVIDAAPEVILVGADTATDPLIASWNAYPEIPAVRCGRVRPVDADLLVRPTTRILQGAGDLCEWLDGTEAVQSGCTLDGS